MKNKIALTMILFLSIIGVGFSQTFTGVNLGTNYVFFDGAGQKQNNATNTGYEVITNNDNGGNAFTTPIVTSTSAEFTNEIDEGNTFLKSTCTTCAGDGASLSGTFTPKGASMEWQIRDQSYSCVGGATNTGSPTFSLLSTSDRKLIIRWRATTAVDLVAHLYFNVRKRNSDNTNATACAGNLITQFWKTISIAPSEVNKWVIDTLDFTAATASSFNGNTTGGGSVIYTSGIRLIYSSTVPYTGSIYIDELQIGDYSSTPAAALLKTPWIGGTKNLTAFSTALGTPTSEQSFIINATKLTTDITVTAPSHFQVSATSGGTFSSSITLTPSIGGSTVYVRYNPSVAGTHTGSISLASTGATTRNVDVSGSSPVISSSGTLNAFTTTAQNSPSAEQSFSVSGVNLTTDITVSAPAGFEVSITSGSGFGSSLNLTPSTGTVNSTTIYVRYNPASGTNASGNISLTSTSAVTQNVAVAGSIVTSNFKGNNLIVESFIYPNPTSGISFVKVNLTKPSSVKLLVNSLAGKEVFSKEIGTLSAGENISEVNFSNLEKGIYSISYIVDGIVAKTEKLVVQ